MISAHVTWHSIVSVVEQHSVLCIVLQSSEVNLIIINFVIFSRNKALAEPKRDKPLSQKVSLSYMLLDRCFNPNDNVLFWK